MPAIAEPVVSPPTPPSVAITADKLTIPEKKWNTANLSKRLGIDVASAATASILVSPIITIVDQSIMENASGKAPLLHSVKTSLGQLLLRPHNFLLSRPFALMFALYAGTYATANTLDTTTSTVKNLPASTTTAGTPKFLATSTANLGLCLYKDSQFTKLFGTTAARPVPPVTYALFAMRDCMSVTAGFNVPPLLAPLLPMGSAAEKYVSRASAAQFIAPAAFQLVSTPLHLLGLDFYNRPGRTAMSERARKVRVDWLKSSLARMCRTVPAFGVGGVVNNGMRKRLMGKLE